MFFAIDRFPSTTLMLGLTDESVEGQWLTFDGKSPSYTNWNQIGTNGREPNGGRASNYAFAYSKSMEDHHGPSVPAGTWNDVGSILPANAGGYMCTYELVCNERKCKFYIARS